MATCLPVLDDPCLEAVLRCAGVDLHALNSIMGRVLKELSLATLDDVFAVIEGILTRLSALEAALNLKLAEITDLSALIDRIPECIVEVGVECASADALVGMLKLRRDELRNQVQELERNLDPIFGLPFQLAQFSAVLNEMICFQLNAMVTQAVIGRIENPPIPPVDPTCPRP